MANKKFTDLTALTTSASGDLVPIVDISDTTDSANGTTKKITIANLPFANISGLTGVIRSDSGVASVDSDVTDIVAAASDTTAGKIEIATIAETTTGTDTARAVSPDGLSGSDYGKRVVGVEAFVSSLSTETGDGKAFFRIPSSMNGWNLVGVAASVYTAGTTNTTDIQIRNKTDSVDMLSTKLTIDSGETDTSTAATPAVIDTTKDDVATGDILAIDVDAVSTTPAQGLFVEMTFQLP